ncbi:MAG: hypothetical protein HON42_01250 [Alphaproteobacteria bacterium]|jgi:hypothetical protein|nr:hypothetical protein [Alphaproteobacteria bacterium]MBT5828253.1 hypothetical protein [Alphaproteobacteria bacterium]
MQETLSLIEKYLETLDRDLKLLLNIHANQDNLDDVLSFIEEAKHNLAFILNSLNHTATNIRDLNDKQFDKTN